MDENENVIIEIPFEESVNRHAGAMELIIRIASWLEDTADISKVNYRRMAERVIAMNGYIGYLLATHFGCRYDISAVEMNNNLTKHTYGVEIVVNDNGSVTITVETTRIPEVETKE